VVNLLRPEVVSLIGVRTFAQDTIYWQPTYKLKWEDFQGIPDSSSKNGATSRPGVKYHLSANEDSFNVTVICFFFKIKVLV
jgi:hypothetical protein